MGLFSSILQLAYGAIQSNTKYTFNIGNLQVAFLTALSIINLTLYDLTPSGIRIDDGSKIIFLIILCYAIFAIYYNFNKRNY